MRHLAEGYLHVRYLVCSWSKSEKVITIKPTGPLKCIGKPRSRTKESTRCRPGSMCALARPHNSYENLVSSARADSFIASSFKRIFSPVSILETFCRFGLATSRIETFRDASPLYVSQVSVSKRERASLGVETLAFPLPDSVLVLSFRWLTWW